MSENKSNISLVIMLTALAGSSFFVYDLLFSPPKHQEGTIIEKIFVPARTVIGSTPYGGARRSNYFIKAEQVEQWIAIVKMESQDKLLVHCMAKHYATKNVGDPIHFKKYEGTHLHIKYFAHNEEED